MEVVLQTLNSISTRLSILEDPAYLNKSDAVEMDPAVISDIMKIFPISSDEQMDDLEFFLSQEENEKLMVCLIYFKSFKLWFIVTIIKILLAVLIKDYFI